MKKKPCIASLTKNVKWALNVEFFKRSGQTNILCFYNWAIFKFNF